MAGTTRTGAGAVGVGGVGGVGRGGTGKGGRKKAGAGGMAPPPAVGTLLPADVLVTVREVGRGSTGQRAVELGWWRKYDRLFGDVLPPERVALLAAQVAIEHWYDDTDQSGGCGDEGLVVVFRVERNNGQPPVDVRVAAAWELNVHSATITRDGGEG
jgi:hypothetical protein